MIEEHEMAWHGIKQGESTIPMNSKHGTLTIEIARGVEIFYLCA